MLVQRDDYFICPAFCIITSDSINIDVFTLNVKSPSFLLIHVVSTCVVAFSGYDVFRLLTTRIASREFILSFALFSLSVRIDRCKISLVSLFKFLSIKMQL